MLDDNLKTSSVSFFIADLNLLSCEFDRLTFKLFYCVIILTKIKLYFVLNEIAFTKNGFFCLFNNKEHCWVFCPF